jgi:hypothetical protein
LDPKQLCAFLFNDRDDRWLLVAILLTETLQDAFEVMLLRMAQRPIRLVAYYYCAICPLV